MTQHTTTLLKLGAQRALKTLFFLVGLCSLIFTQTSCQQEGSSMSENNEATASLGKQSPYEVGSTTIFIHDDSRPFDAVGGVNSGVRTLITEIWYPVARGDVDASSTRASYGDYAFGNRSIHHKMLTETIFFHLDAEWVRDGVTVEDMQAASDELYDRPRGSFVELPPASGELPFPVIVMSHGDAGSRYSMETVCEDLARHGYIVVAPEHTGNSPYTMVGMDPALSVESGDKAYQNRMAEVLPLLDEHGAYGLESHNGQSYSPLSGELDAAGLIQLDLSLVERVNDLRAVLNKLDELDRGGPFAGRLDMSRIGLMGRSFGGATTLAGLMLEPRFTAGFAVVPPALPDTRALLPKEMLVTAPRESAIFSADESLSLAQLHKPTMLLSGGEDDLIIGLGYQMAEATGGTLPSKENPFPLLKRAFDTAKVPAIMSIVQDTNHGSFGVAAPYWWPELKPNTFPKFFDKNSDYQLLDASIAHRIQQEMALAFFDLTLKGDSTQLQTLRKNPWLEYDTSVDVRGFGTAYE